MLGYALLTLALIGINSIVWSIAGGLRYFRESAAKRAGGPRPHTMGFQPRDVAVVIAARNEELVLGQTIRSVLALVPAGNLFVASDASTDRTAVIARKAGARVLELKQNRGKAGALVAAIEHFDIPRRFAVVMFLDADTQLAGDYFSTGLPLFEGADVVAVAGHALTLDEVGQRRSLGARIVIGYRDRVYALTQYLHKYGQASHGVNVVSIVPGFASMYLTRIIPQIDIAAAGLSIEDYNMTFEVHAQQLGHIAFVPGCARAYTQDPDTLREYAKQVRRWDLGFWQTVRRHRFRARLFWWALAALIIELVASSIILLAVIPVMVLSGLGAVTEALGAVPEAPLVQFSHTIPVLPLLTALFLIDYLLTTIAVIISGRYGSLLYGIAFPLLRVVDAALCLATLVRTFRSGASGLWTSPERRQAAQLDAAK